jgi:phage terminase large subunit-like protein
MTKTYPTWVFDDSPIEDTFGDGERAVRFLRALRHPKSNSPGHAFQLPRWQERIVRRIEGPRHPDGTRIVRNVPMLVPRGGRKTSLGAALALLHLFGPERTNGGQIICAAYDRDQARIAFEEAAGIVRQHPATKKATSILDYRHRIKHPKSGSFLQAVSSDAAAQNGRTPSFCLVDEIHAWRDRKLYGVLRTGLSKVRGSLLVVISQAGRGQDGIAWETYEYARKVARGEIDDPGTLPILFETPADADWQDEALWHRVNPGLADGYPDLDSLRQEAREAIHKPVERERFKNDHLNIWLDHSTDPFVDMAVYDRGSTPIDMKALAGRPCWLGVDMSTTTDLTAVVAAFHDDDGGYIVLPHFFVPADNLRAKADKDGVPYPTWAQEGHLTATPGNVIDYRAVENYIRDLDATYDVREINFDPAYAQPVMGPLGDNGLPVQTMRQGWVTQSPALNELERAIVAGKFQHGAHPVLRWCFSNVAIHTDSAGNRTMHKGKSTNRIDGAVASWMAVARCAAGESNVSQYNSPESTGLFIF